MKLKEDPVVPFATKVVIELGPEKSLLILGIRWLGGPSEGGEFLSTPSPHRLDEGPVGVAYEVRKGRRLPVFLAHEEEGNEGREQYDSRGKLHSFQTDQLAQAFPLHPVSHLVMVLREDHKSVRRDILGGVSVAAPTVRGVLPRVDEALVKCFGEIPELSEVLVIPRPFTGQQRMEGVVEVVVPLGIEAVSPQLPRPDNPRVIEGTLGNEVDPSVEPFRLIVHRQGQLLKKGMG